MQFQQQICETQDIHVTMYIEYIIENWVQASGKIQHKETGEM